MNDIRKEIDTLKKEKLELENKLKEAESKGFIARLWSEKKTDLETNIIEIKKKLLKLEAERKYQSIEAKSQQEKEDLDEAKEYFVRDENDTIKVRDDLLEEGLTLFRDQLPNEEDKKEKIKLIDILIKNIAFALLDGIKDNEGNPDRPTEAQLYFTIGVTYFDKAQYTESDVYYRYAHNAYENAKRIASEVRRTGLVFQLDGAIENIKDKFPEYDGQQLDCLRPEEYDFRTKYEDLYLAFKKHSADESEDIVFETE